MTETRIQVSGLDQYQLLAQRTALYPGQGERDGVNYAVLGLCGESGEVAEQLKKSWRDDGEITPERRLKMKKEMGDALWYLAQLATELDFDLSDVASDNIEKLASRKERDLIHGEGSDR